MYVDSEVVEEMAYPIWTQSSRVYRLITITFLPVLSCIKGTVELKYPGSVNVLSRLK